MNQPMLFNNLKFHPEPEEVDKKLEEIRRSNDKDAFRLFQNHVFNVLLHQNLEKYRLIERVIEQAKEKGMSYVLCKISNEARKFCDMSRQVSFERHRAVSFIRLQPIDRHRVLFGEFELKHNTAELIMLHFLQRFPQYTIILVFGEEAYIGKGKEIFKKKFDRKKMVLPQKKDDFERFWLAFYRSQFIPQRRNITYLKRMIPKKYWKWVSELKEFGLC